MALTQAERDLLQAWRNKVQAAEMELGNLKTAEEKWRSAQEEAEQLKRDVAELVPVNEHRTILLPDGRLLELFRPRSQPYVIVNVINVESWS